MFSEDIGLLPESFFTGLLEECRRGSSSYDLLGPLFRQKNEPQPARGGSFAGVDYFNGGLFATVEPRFFQDFSCQAKAPVDDKSRLEHATVSHQRNYGRRSRTARTVFARGISRP